MMGKSKYTIEYLNGLVGVRYDMLEVISTHKSPSLGTMCTVKCDCGKIKEYKVTVLINGRAKSCGCKISKNIPKVGDRFQNNKGQWCTVLEPNKWDDILVQFDETGTIKSFQSDSLKRKIFHDPLFKAYWGFGCMGDGIYNGVDHKSAFNTWMHMVERCYDTECQHYGLYGGKGVTVCDEWSNFQTFAEWFTKNKVDGWHLDKDFKNPSSNSYSTDNCVYLPPAVNSIFTGSNRGIDTGVGRSKQGRFTATASCALTARRKHLGTFKTWIDAKVAYLEEKRKMVEKLIKEYDLPKEVRYTMFEMTSIWYYLK